MPTYSRWYDAASGVILSTPGENGFTANAKVVQSFDEREAGIVPAYSSAHRVCATSKAFNGIDVTSGGGISNGVSQVGCSTEGFTSPDSSGRQGSATWTASASNPSSSLTGDSYSASMTFGRWREAVIGSLSLSDLNREAGAFRYPDPPAGAIREVESDRASLDESNIVVEVTRAEAVSVGGASPGSATWGFMTPSALGSSTMAAYTPTAGGGGLTLGAVSTVPLSHLQGAGTGLVYVSIGVLHSLAFTGYDPGSLGVADPGSAVVAGGYNAGFVIRATYIRPRYRWVYPDPVDPSLPVPPPAPLRGWKLGAL